MCEEVGGAKNGSKKGAWHHKLVFLQRSIGGLFPSILDPYRPSRHQGKNLEAGV